MPRTTIVRSKSRLPYRDTVAPLLAACALLLAACARPAAPQTPLTSASARDHDPAHDHAPAHDLGPGAASTRGSANDFAPPESGYLAVHVPAVPLPDPAAGGAVSLDQMLAFADRQAPALAVARARLELGYAAVRGAAPLLSENPEVSISAGPRHSAEGTFTDLGVSLSQRLELGGERGLRREAARHVQARVEAELDEARWDVHREVHAAFHRALVARERLAAADRVLAFQERLVDIARRRLQAGDVSPLAVRVAEGELSQTRVTRVGVAQRYLRARLELGALAGWPAAHPPEPAGALDEPREPPDFAHLVEVARGHQPRLRSLHAARLEAEARARAADRDAWPEPSVGIELMREGGPAGMEETVVLGTLSLALPVAQRNQQARAQARAELRVAEAEGNAFGSQLGIRIEQHRTAVVAAAAQVRGYAREILPMFEENLRLIQRAFELGEIDILQVSVARERFLRIQSDALDAYTDYFDAVAELEAAIGADLWPDEQHEHGPSEEHTAPEPAADQPTPAATQPLPPEVQP
ncbi:outer membrane efflux protein [Haliangium ochraceum DSM 14365]|uniref:Outer membrane efflux protein n=1 Tax=Haliangium ochraceum (strain DSM 14365 / JCM 11303 / SMP-2) TaxID=502025 RepID=D0LMA3_HALO1|nr:outer membrane efflux protein [Haliangium ochraceum DSM 14365]